MCFLLKIVMLHLFSNNNRCILSIFNLYIVLSLLLCCIKVSKSQKRRTSFQWKQNITNYCDFDFNRLTYLIYSHMPCDHTSLNHWEQWNIWHFKLLITVPGTLKYWNDKKKDLRYMSIHKCFEFWILQHSLIRVP